MLPHAASEGSGHAFGCEIHIQMRQIRIMTVRHDLPLAAPQKNVRTRLREEWIQFQLKTLHIIERKRVGYGDTARTGFGIQAIREWRAKRIDTPSGT